MATKELTFVDVAIMFNRRYASGISEAKRVRDVKNLWKKITDGLFIIYGERLGVEDLSDFRSRLEKTRKEIKEKTKESKGAGKRIVQQLVLDLKPWWYYKTQESA